jgi:cysteine desulfurase
VQTVGHYTHHLGVLPLHFMVGAAHKFHGPKGIGFLHINHKVKLSPFIHGGAQERNMRGGTENIYGIIGLAKALEIAYSGMNEHRTHIENLKQRFMHKLLENVPGVSFNGASHLMDKSLYTVLNVSLPPSDFTDMLLFKLDIARISASGGSACSSGSNVGSHVLKALQADPNRGAVRFSFSKYNSAADVDAAVEVLAGLYAPIASNSYMA